MPSTTHPQAKFDPIPPDLDLSALVESTSNFDYVTRISMGQVQELGAIEFEKLVLLHVVVGGKPLVVEGWQGRLPPWLFSPTWLQDNVGKKEEEVRDIGNGTNIPMTIGHYMTSLEKLTKQWTTTNFREPKRQRLYLKDIDCPEQWCQYLSNTIPQTLFYLNDCVGEIGGPGAVRERNMYNQLALGRGIAPAGDLMCSLPPEMRAQNMMCYIGHEGTYTPAHREMCASLGQNIMVETSEASQGEKPGSSIWFMTESKDREVVSEYFLSMLGHDIEVEGHFAQINAWKKAPFPVYILEQKVGDFILIPPLAPHQVWNRGTRTMKAAWNRTTVETLEMALHEALPRARMVCRDEQYKCKAIVYYSLLRYYDQLRRVEQIEENNLYTVASESVRSTARVRQLQKDFRRLFTLYTEILISEMFSPDSPKEKRVEFLPFDSNVTCSYCRCNIFNRFLTCKTCVGDISSTTEEDTYDICMDCYAMGRSCSCISNLQWVEQWQWSVLLQRYEEWGAMVVSLDGQNTPNSAPQSLDDARMITGKKSIAQVCQEQLKLRPWHDISKPIIYEPQPGESDVEPEVDENGRPKKRKVTKRELDKLKKTQMACHICRREELLWKLAICTTCMTAYCYGSLWRGFDLKPETVMQNPNWQCPKCMRVCSCTKCQKLKRPTLLQTPYRPKGTLLGHDTRAVADPRSVESLVDFSRTNLFWLRNEGDQYPQRSQRMQNLVQKAQAEKSRDKVLNAELAAAEDDLGTDHVPQTTEYSAIDPQLQYSHSTADPQSLGHINPKNHQCSFGNDYVPRAHAAMDSLRGGAGNSTQRGCIDPAAATLAVDEPSYPDPSALGRDRMMGMGYYQQGTCVDRILFDHPDAITPVEQNMNSSYPRQQQESVNPLFNQNKKRGHTSPSTAGDNDTDEAHKQFLKAQKRPKLDDARKEGVFHMTKNQIDSGGSLTIKLRFENNREFLQGLDDLSKDEKLTRHNPRPFRRSISGQKLDPEAANDTIIVMSDVPSQTFGSVYQKQVVDIVDSLTTLTKESKQLANKAMKSTRVTEKRKRGRPPLSRKTRPPKGEERLSREAKLQDSETASLPIGENRRTSARLSESRALFEHHLERDMGQTISQPVSFVAMATEIAEPDLFTKEPKRNPGKMALDEVHADERVLGCLASPTSQDPEIDSLLGSNPASDLFNVEFDLLYPPSGVASPAGHSPIFGDYENAKLMALRMAEGETEENFATASAAVENLPSENIIFVKPPPEKTVTPTPPQLRQMKTVSVPNKTSPSLAKDVATLPAEARMLMAERQALQDKTIKIAAARSALVALSSIAPAVSPIIKNSPETATFTLESPMFGHPRRTSDAFESSPSSNSTSDGDEEILTVRPNSSRSRYSHFQGDRLEK